jgi:Ca2+-binding RTX toxin-like protein
MAGTIKLPSDATEADIVKAIEDLPNGGTIILPQDKVIAIRSGLDIDVAHRNITLDLNGATLKKAGDVSVITGLGSHDDAASVKLSVNGAGNTVARYAERPEDLKAGDWVKVLSDDRLPGDHMEGKLPTRMGQAMEVAKVEGNVVTFKDALIDQGNYDTNVRASTYRSGELTIKNGDIVGDQKHPGWNLPLVQLRSLVDAQVENVTVRDNVGRGISVVDSVNADLSEVIAKNLLDGGSAALGIAVSSLSSTGTTVSGLYAENITHAADNNAMGIIPNSPFIERYGGDIGMTVSDSVAVGARDFAWSWHSEAIDGAFKNVMAFDSYGFLMARGIGGKMTDSGGAGNERGVLLYEYGDKDARDITLDGLTLRETLNYALFASNDPRNNSITNSVLESFGPGNLSSLLQVAVGAVSFLTAGGNSNEALAGTGGADMLLGGKGADDISGGGGNDYIWGGSGGDHLTGGAGRDRFVFLNRGERADVITDFKGGNGGDFLDLSALAANSGWEDGDPVANGYLRLVQKGEDVEVQVENDGDGRDFKTLVTLENIDKSAVTSANIRTALSEDPASTPTAPSKPDTPPSPHQPTEPTDPVDPVPGGGVLRGTDGDNVLRGSVDVDHIIGWGGDDRMTASIVDTVLEGGNGDDIISGNRGNDVLKGGNGSDWLSGGDGEDKLYGDAGDDTLLGGADADTLAGGRGYDTADYGSAANGVVADILSDRSNGGGAASDRFSSIENLTGSDYNDTLRGNKGANILQGGNGDDTLLGRAGADTLVGGDGSDWLDGGAWKDVLTGGRGADSFYFAHASQAGDTITDFQNGYDHVVLSGGGFGIDSHADFNFVEGLAATTAQATVLFDKSSGQVLWDADGTGSREAVNLATFSISTNFSDSDILIG